jgi:hypothetical protein
LISRRRRIVCPGVGAASIAHSQRGLPGTVPRV